MPFPHKPRNIGQEVNPAAHAETISRPHSLAIQRSFVNYLTEGRRVEQSHQINGAQFQLQTHRLRFGTYRTKVWVRSLAQYSQVPGSGCPAFVPAF